MKTMLRTVCLLLAVLASAAHAQSRDIRLATTTSTENSGLLKIILPMFEAKYDGKVRVISVGTGAALKLGENGDADVVLVHARALEALAWAGLADRREVPPHKLSSGENQRAALARPKVLDPTLLLLDEPTSNLDGDSRRQVLELVTALCIEKHTVVVASHDPEIMRLAILNRLRVSDRRLVADD